jgi:hypothetical protein
MYQPQSGKVGTIEMEKPSHVDQTITAFADQTAGWTVDISSQPDSTMDLAASTPSDIGTFLERPVRIGTYSWAVGSPLFQKFNPWTLWVENPRVREKMAYYNLLRCKLHVKVVISGTGFHYGRALLGYNPWSVTDQLTVTRNFLEVDMVQLSQKPNIFLNPTLNQGGEMVLPFFYNHNYVSLPELEYRDLGEMYLKSFQDLAHANGGDDPVHITVYAWAEDVTLTVPTSTYVAQSGKRLTAGDEYGKGIVSSTASAIAEAAGSLAEAPIIGPYARATEVCARAGADVARHFGYSRPPVITDEVLIKPLLAGNLANTDAADAVSKLTLDSKQELTIDSRTVGLDGKDQMDLKSIVARQSYLTQFTWDPATVVDTLLWNSRVGPALWRQNADELHPTPMSMIASLFERWQGTIKFRFQVVKSSFHKGRLLIRWDPHALIGGVQYNTVYSRVIDIAEEDDFEVEVGWGQSAPFLRSAPITKAGSPPFSTSTLLADTSGEWNGVLDVVVLNSLVSPSADSSIKVNVFVSMCDDAKFGGPTSEGIKNLSLFPGDALAPQSGYRPQSGEILADPVSEDTDKPGETHAVTAIAPTMSVTDRQMQVFFGESPKSLRELFRRYCFTQMYSQECDSTNLTHWKLVTYALPDNYGWDPNGSSTYTTASGANPATLVQQTPLGFMMGCYAGWRGSLRKKLACVGDLRWPIVCRSGFDAVENTLTSVGTSAAVIVPYISRNYGMEGFNGQAIQDVNNVGTLEVECPYYIGKRMSTARTPTYSFNNGCENIKFETFLKTSGSAVNGAARVLEFCATGEDFSLFFFTGCPILYEYALN